MAIDYPNSIDVQEVNDEIWFDIINRTITLKEGQSIQDILVQNDANSRNFGFMIQRYFENEDLSTKNIRIHYVNSLNQHDFAFAHSIEVVGENKDVLSFQWLISAKVCLEVGNVQFAIEFYDENGYALFTTPAIVSVSKGVYTLGSIPDPDYDWVKSFAESMAGKEDKRNRVKEISNDGDDNHYPTAKAVYDYGENIKTDVNTALATLEQGIFKALPSGTVNLWELESGLYRVSSNVTINASQTEILPKPAKPYSYLYVSGESYMGSTDKRYIVGWAYLVSTLYDNRYAAKVFTGATYTDGTARGSTSELVTETKLTALEKRLDTKLETALSGKVNKSDILSNVNKNAESQQIYNAPTINTELANLEKNTFKEIASPCHIAELEKGIYVIKGSVSDGNGQVTIANVFGVSGNETLNDNYFAIINGLLIVHENIKDVYADGNETSIISFTAQGDITVPNQSHSGDFLDYKQTIKEATSVQGYVLESHKFAENTELFEANKWYSEMPEMVLSDIPASAIKNEITTESTIYDVPSALAVRNYVNQAINSLQGNIDEVSALVGGA